MGLNFKEKQMIDTMQNAMVPSGRHDFFNHLKGV